MDKDFVMKKVKEHMGEIRKYGVKRIGLFGSYVADRQKASSDIDLVVEFEEGKATLDNYLGLLSFLEGLFGRKVDLITREGIRSIRIEEVKKSIEDSVIYVS